jgi:hypothetical protein
VFESLLGEISDGGNAVGMPMNIKHKVHVDEDLSWTGDAFELQDKLGTGYIHIFKPPYACI